MRLKSLELSGFKSFPDTTRVEFHDGITAIVGPNGCGKSNIGDAIRWVLGEQRPTAIRGARMEEAIFQGTVARRALSRGAVSMVVTNEDGALPTPFREVEIGRTIYRDGGSNYRLNRSPCRLRDIVDLCRDTGLGANAYSIIEIRMIDAILSERTDERRSLFEEAAGIGKYKDRRRAAMRRLETSEADLQRLEDVIGEVRSKVRSLARQKGKAQRHRELRDRRLAVEIAVVGSDLEDMRARLAQVEHELAHDRDETAGMAARLATAESELQRARLAHLEAEKVRVDAAGRLDGVRNRLATVEREVAVAGERIGNGKRRLEQIAREKEALAGLRARSTDEILTLRREQDNCKAELTSCKAELTSRRQTAAETRVRMEVARDELAVVERRSREVARAVARVEGDLDSARLQTEELDRRLERLTADSRAGAGALRELRSQGDLFVDRSRDATRQVERSRRDLERSRRRAGMLRDRLRGARAAELEARTRVAALETEVSAVRRMTLAGEGAEAVAADAAEAFPDRVIGMLSDCVRVEGTAARTVDDALARFGLALLVAGGEDIEQIEHWYRSEAGRVARLVLLPLDRIPEPRGALPPGVAATGKGAPWVRALLGGVTFQPSPSGDEQWAPGWTDLHGAVHLVPDTGAEGRLERTEHLDGLEARVRASRGELEEARRVRSHVERESRKCEEEVDALTESLLSSRDAARAAEVEAEVQSGRRQQLARHQDELARQLEGTRAARERAAERAAEADSERVRLLDEEKTLGARLEELRSLHAAVDVEWEQARSAESEAVIRLTRLEGDLGRLGDRISDAEKTVTRTRDRIAGLEREAQSLEEEIVRVREEREQAQKGLEGMFRRRDELQGVLSEQDRQLREASAGVLKAERNVGEVRDLERNAVEGRHQLELERQDLANRAARIGERLETEWGRPLETLLDEVEPAEGDAEALRGELGDITARLARLGPVNMLAVEEHAEESARLEFLVGQQDDLVSARDDLKAAIRRINATATELFMTTFEAIRENFQRTFEHLFSGGEANLWLGDPDDPLESRVEIHAAPRGKKTQRIDLLSGGERALTALSLLFGIYLVKPSPFCVLDEVDAPLDESNIGRFVRLLQGFKAQTQFVVITHNPWTIEAADWIYGVTMEEPGVSSIVGVRLEGRTEAAGTAA
ncbi:MAG: AAA family ATPase [Gemmatimonadetes bacterium]|nr:AAA family ATPase [Gemmatimonadota bacterium]